jgi:hypothetical protein
MSPEQTAAHMAGRMMVDLIVGAVCGLLPFFIALAYKRLEVGIIALVASIVSGFLFGLFLSVPMALIFTVILLSIGSLRPKRRRRRVIHDYDDDDDDDDDDYRPRPRHRRFQ